MAMKTWIWLFFTLTVLGGMVFFYVDFVYFAGVIDIGIFSAALCIQIFLGVYAIIKREKTFIYGGLLVMLFSIIVFLIGAQSYTDKEVPMVFKQQGVLCCCGEKRNE